MIDTPAIGLGFEHIAAGADHLLFLLLLLLPAPLLGLRAGGARVVLVVTAFAAGHSVTLALTATGVVHPPSAPVEFLIALSIAVAAVHAVRPLVPGGEAPIAAGFGLVHGLAFGAHVADPSVASLIGFNVGIELAQLAVVALFLPSLYLLSRTPAYAVVRTGVAGAGCAFAVGWMIDRAGLLTDPFEGITTALVDHPFVVASAFAALAAFAAAAYRPVATR